MNIKKSNFLEDRFKLSSLSPKSYNVNAGNQQQQQQQQILLKIGK